MASLTENWDPNEWELYVYGLLQDRHGSANVLKVPSRHRGDHGIDYYCLKDQIAYQCYAVQEPCEVSDRADKQKTKITTDLGKLRSNAAELHKLFGEIKINRWALVVPLHDSADVNKHLTKKGAEVRACALPFIAADFEAIVQDLDGFEKESVVERALRRQTISLQGTPPSPQEIVAWSSASISLVTALTQKMRKRSSTLGDPELNELVNSAIEWFLERENFLETLRTNAPQLYETLVGVITRHTDRLRLYGPPETGAAREVLRVELEGLVRDLKAAVPNFSDKSAQQLALGTISDWLMRCPLDFPPYSHA